MRSTDKTKRRNALSHFGFGVDAMKNTTVCTNCYSLENSNKMFCGKCGTRLTGASLYEYYRLHHRSCRKCGTTLSDAMDFCPRCGTGTKETGKV